MSHSPAIPTYVLRGHISPVHNLLFFNDNAYLASGDSNGWLVVWSIASKRPVAVWKAHEGSVSGIKIWATNQLITHGRDHKLRVWKLVLGDKSGLSIQLPVEGGENDQPKPWLLHSMDVGALNFCTFAICKDLGPVSSNKEEVLIASPNGLDSGGVDLFQLPSERRVSQLHSQNEINTGMVMTLAMANQQDRGLCLVSGYEDGHVMVHRHAGPLGAESTKWQKVMAYKAHTQPVLSLDTAPQNDYFISSSADAVLAKFAIPDLPTRNEVSNDSLKLIDTKHAGQQGLSVRSDGRIFATAGWDARVRVYSSKTMKELAVLKWHKDGCYSIAFATLENEDEKDTELGDSDATVVISSGTALDKIKEERSVKAQRTHWLAAGGKDGKISLWDIY